MKWTYNQLSHAKKEKKKNATRKKVHIVHIDVSHLWYEISTYVCPAVRAVPATSSNTGVCMMALVVNDWHHNFERSYKEVLLLPCFYTLPWSHACWETYYKLDVKQSINFWHVIHFRMFAFIISIFFIIFNSSQI